MQELGDRATGIQIPLPVKKHTVEVHQEGKLAYR
jgi:hypothetical protein